MTKEEVAGLSGAIFTGNGKAEEIMKDAFFLWYAS